jgi:hypothetical protein
MDRNHPTELRSELDPSWILTTVFHAVHFAHAGVTGLVTGAWLALIWRRPTGEAVSSPARRSGPRRAP